MLYHPLTFSSLSIKPSPIAAKITLVSAVILLASCGSRDSGVSSPAEYVGQAADNITTEVLQRNASNATGGSLGTTMDSVLQTISGSAAIGKAVSVPGFGLVATQSSPDALNDPSETEPLFDLDFDNRVRSESNSLFDSTLGLSGNSAATREGNSITIDPDESEICLQQNVDDALSQANCEQLLADLIVNIEASSDRSGVISYFFKNELVVEIGYSPVYGSYELKLAGLNSVLNRMAELDPTNHSSSATMSGSVKFEATVLNASAGAEAGSLKFSIPEALSVISIADDINVSLAPSTIMEMTADSASGLASMEIGLGALTVASRNNDLAGSPLQKLAMSGLTARGDLTRNGKILTMSNVSLGNGPLVLTVDSMEAIRASLDTFGFTVNQEANAISMTGDMNFAVATRNVFGVLDETTSHAAAVDYAISAASGTTLSELASGVMRVDQGGPLSVQYSVFDGNASANGTVAVQQGQCFGEQVASDSPIDLTACN